MKSIKNIEVIKGDNIISDVTELFKPLTKLPSPKAKFNLNTDQKYWYKYFGKILVATRKLVEPDLIHLYRLCRSIDYYIQAENAINESGYVGGLVQKTPNNYYQISAHVTVREKMIKDIESISAHFGFSFLDRKKLGPQDSGGGQIDMFKQFLNQKVN